MIIRGIIYFVSRRRGANAAHTHKWERYRYPPTHPPADCRPTHARSLRRRDSVVRAGSRASSSPGVTPGGLCSRACGTELGVRHTPPTPGGRVRVCVCVCGWLALVLGPAAVLATRTRPLPATPPPVASHGVWGDIAECFPTVQAPVRVSETASLVCPSSRRVCVFEIYLSLSIFSRNSLSIYLSPSR